MRLFITELLPNNWSDCDEIFCRYSGGFENGLGSQFGPLEAPPSKACIQTANVYYIFGCGVSIYVCMYVCKHGIWIHHTQINT